MPFLARRTFADFVWLESALRSEYNGGVLVPLLSIAMAVACDGLPLESIIKSNQRVNHKVLEEWLSDILNGIRGQGEQLMYLPSVKIINSESMETFLYRNTDPLPLPDLSSPKSRLSLNTLRQVNLAFLDAKSNSFSWKAPEDEIMQIKSATSNESTFKYVLTKGLGCFAPESIGEGDRRPSLPLDMISCTSRANNEPMLDEKLNDISFPIQPSPSTVNSRGVPPTPSSSQFVTHSDLLEAHKVIVASRMSTTHYCLEKILEVKSVETHRSGAWKRLAISLSALFIFEKDIEVARVGDSKSTKAEKEKSEESKAAVDDALRVLARHKCDRSIPSLKLLQVMLTAYLNDLAAVQPCLDAYSEAAQQLSTMETSSNRGQKQRRQFNFNDNDPEMGSKDSSDWSSHLKAIATEKLKQIGDSFGMTPTTTGTNYSGVGDFGQDFQGAHEHPPPMSLALRAIESRVVGNEALLKESLSMLNRSVPVRVSRMSWKYFKMEAGQASLLASSVSSIVEHLSNLTNMTSHDNLADQREREDDNEETDIVRRLLDLGHSDDDNLEQAQQHGANTQEQKIREMLKERALLFSSVRVGRWNAEMALAVMEAAGIEDAEVRVEETTRDLRLVRKYAIGLRGCVERCVEAIRVLTSSVDEHPTTHKSWKRMDDADDASMVLTDAVKLKEMRENFIASLSVVFAGGHNASRDRSSQSRSSSSPSSSILAKNGIDTDDRAGWLLAIHQSQSTEHQRSVQVAQNLPEARICGHFARSYIDRRDSGETVLLSRIDNLLRDYERRVEGIESFVYMHCVGIQLEKHFSKERSEAVTVWEKKTDITTAINIATRKRLPLLVKELQAKLDALPKEVSHTVAKRAKERHLVSKELKTRLHTLANLRFMRAKMSATERISTILRLWAQYEEFAASSDLEALDKTVKEIERSVTMDDIAADGGAHLFALGSSSSSLAPSFSTQSKLEGGRLWMNGD